MPRPSPAERFERIDLQIRRGHWEEARREIETIARRPAPRASAAMFAALAQRVGLPELGLRALSRIVHPGGGSPGEATDEERAEYALCLIKIGALEEAMGILAPIDGKEFPRALLYRAFGCAHRWDYAESVPLLREYLASSRLSLYQRLVAQLNLAAALVFLRELTPATALLRGLLHETSVRRLPLLHANALELSAESFILRRQWSAAEGCLERASKTLRGSRMVYEFLVKKWSQVLDFMRGRAPSLDPLRELARKRGHWETLRECDRFGILRDRDEALAARVYFGTPHRAYRRRLMEELGGELRLPDRYLWVPGRTEGRTEWEIDLFSGKALRAGKIRGSLRPGMQLHRLLVTLGSDFYRPFRTATLFARLYPDECYHLQHSPARVYEAVKALRKWLKETGLPCTVQYEGAAYRLRSPGGVSLRIVRSDLLGEWKAPELDRLRRQWPAGEFSVAEAVTCLGLARRSVQRLLQKATADGTLERRGAKGYTRYRFAA